MAKEQYNDVRTEFEDITKHSDLQRGDHLAVSGNRICVKYFHHGIFLGDEKGVADFGGTGKRDATLKIVNIHTFTNNGKRRLIRIKYAEGCCLHPEKAALNAEELVADPTKWGNYHLLTNNCEHFATKCKTGLAVSEQVIENIRNGLNSPIKCCILNTCISSCGCMS
ncbi:hypothetical protein DPMN_013046 [Dreissena polymorpha]|uniref:LRAT domain-containing protein n=1 Tax=Dreissena polymorpha TaxID=45954 RepID=A0A9D4N760_DREPO|nr:hypothetical protein DPMN_013046 [Dreissena polymorpha]